MRIRTERLRHSLEAVLTCVLTGSLVRAQAQVPTPPPPNVNSVVQAAPMTLPDLYWHFLIVQNRLDAEAAALAAKGEDGSWLRDSNQKGLGFTDDEFAIVRAAAQRLEPELRALDMQAKAVRAAWRERYRAQFPFPRGAPPPPAPPELHELQRQRKELIESEAAKLREELGPELAARMDDYLTRSVRNEKAPQIHAAPNPEGRRQRTQQRPGEAQP